MNIIKSVKKFKKLLQNYLKRCIIKIRMKCNGISPPKNKDESAGTYRAVHVCTFIYE